METWRFISVSLYVATFLKSLYDFLFPKPKLPPGPTMVPFIRNLQWLLKLFLELEPIIRNLHTNYGQIITLQIGSCPAIFISTNSLAHWALVQNGFVFADRPEALPADRILSSNQHNISLAVSGPTWRLLCQNLTAEILHPSRVRSYSHARKWVLEILTSRLQGHSGSGESVQVVDHFQYAMFCLLVLVCFGDKLEEKQIQEIETIQRRLLLGLPRFNILNFCPRVAKEINGVVGEGKEEVKEEDLQKLPYLKAVILEGLRRHPPGHFALPHSVTQDITFEGYVIPKNASVNFMVSEMGWNPNIWDDPMVFKPERFLNSKGNGDEVFDITGSRQIKMIPFGTGRRICPGYGLAMLHLEYFVSNLVWSFEWKAVDGDEVDLSEKEEFTVVMKNLLQVHLSPRWK